MSSYGNDSAAATVDFSVLPVIKRSMQPGRCRRYPRAMLDSALEIAADIDSVSVSSFKKISYPIDVVDSVEGFFFWHDLLLFRLYRCVWQFPNEKIKYIQVATVNKSSSHSLHCLTDIDP